MTLTDISPAVDLDRLGREILAAQVALADAERAVRRDEDRAQASRADAAARRVELGKLLIQARGGWPRSGPRARGWGEFLVRQGIGEDSALRYMQLAGYVVEVSRTDSDVRENSAAPTYADAGIDKRPRKSKPEPEPDEPDEDEDDADDVPDPLASWQRNIDRALVGLDKMIMGYAKSWPKRSRADLAATLRSVAERIERMPGE